jgi:hypothetical protein
MHVQRGCQPDRTERDRLGDGGRDRGQQPGGAGSNGGGAGAGDTNVGGCNMPRPGCAPPHLGQGDASASRCSGGGGGGGVVVATSGLGGYFRSRL